MSDYCQQCSVHMFGEDFKELGGQPGYALCEGCGEAVPVDEAGKRTDGKWLQPHTKEWTERLKQIDQEASG